jgi:hypothetical protein
MHNVSTVDGHGKSAASCRVVGAARKENLLPLDPAVVFILSAVAILSLTIMGIPCNGPLI